MKKWIFILLFVWPIVGCDLVGNNDKSPAPFDAGPILFIYNGQLWSMEEDGSDIKQLTFDPDFPIADAKWSPEGNKIAVIASEGLSDNWNATIYIMNADGTERHKIEHSVTVGNLLPRHFAWSSKGDEIVFNRISWGKFYTIVANLKTGIEVIVSEFTHVMDWQPYSKELLLSFTKNGSRRLGLFNLNNDSLNVLGETDFNYGSGRIAPDGSKVAYSKDNALYVLDFETHEERLLFDQIDYAAPRAWSPGSDKLVFQNWASSPEERQVYTINTETGKVKNITPFPSKETEIWVSSWCKE